MEITLNLDIPDNILHQLQNKAEEQNITLDAIVLSMILDGVDEDELPDTPDEEILDHLEISMRQALAGNYRDADEVLDEIEQKLGIKSSRK